MSRSLFRELETVPFLGDAVRQQNNMLVCGMRVDYAPIRLIERRSNLRTAIGSDAGDEAFDQRLVLSAAYGHCPLIGVVENQDADRIHGSQVVHNADCRQTSQFYFSPLHGG